MNLKNRMILEEYRELKPDFVMLGDTVSAKLKSSVKNSGIEVLAIEHRVKEEESLSGKLELKGDKYASLADITDILGARVICFFSDDVDRVAAIIEKMFDVDWENSVDKRAQLNPDSFGYLSLHYICSLPSGGEYPDNICNKKFEIQIRSTLQHTWAAINHDLGYKSDFGVPKAITREFSRVAGLLEIADEEFVHIRDNVKSYGDEIRNKIKNNTATDVLIDLVSLKEYVQHNKAMRAFLKELTDMCHAEISEINPESYLIQLAWFGFKTIGDLQNMLDRDKTLALQLAAKSLSNTDLDILSSNVGLRYLCRAELMNKGYTAEQVTEFIKLSVGDSKRAQRQTKNLFDSYNKLINK